MVSGEITTPPGFQLLVAAAILLKEDRMKQPPEITGKQKDPPVRCSPD